MDMMLLEYYENNQQRHNSRRTETQSLMGT
jgi:hypothetical protein